MNRCTKCLIPDTRPDTAFVDGVCSACISYEKRKETPWDIRRTHLNALLAHAREAKAPYDVVVPSSGGKDSHWQALTLKEMGVRVLAVTATTCHLTPVGKHNIENLARHVPTIEVTPNMTVRRALNKRGLQMVGDISWPEHAGIFSVPFRIAALMGIPLIFYGECPQEAYGGPLGSETAQRMDARWTSEFGGFLGLRPSDLANGDTGITAEDMAHYRLPPPSEMAKVTAYFLGQFLPWDSQRNAEVARDAGMMWQRPGPMNWWPYENLDCALTGIHDYFMFAKYGYGRLCAQISVDIRRGAITREDAYKVVQARDGAYPQFYLDISMAEILRRIGMTVSEMMTIRDKFTNHSLFCREEEGRLILKEFE